MPDYLFNSALITMYKDGNDYIGFHSDDEPEIIDNSKIVTVSLGETRQIQFRPKTNKSTCGETSFSLVHGTVYSMSKESQDSYQHSIPKDNSKTPRISITFRLLSAPHHSVLTETENLCNHPIKSPTNHKQHTVYISSSMFRELNPAKMSTSSQNATVLFYPGATAGDMLDRLQKDHNFKSIQSDKVTKVYLLCATNDVDKVLSIPRSMDKAMVYEENVKFRKQIFDDTTSKIKQLVSYLQNWAHTASINIINILPRESSARNNVINDLNQFMKDFSVNNEHINFIGTEKQRSLFCWKDGNRKRDFFRFHGADNVHFNRLGISRLAKHLKYLAHL